MGFRDWFSRKRSRGTASKGCESPSPKPLSAKTPASAQDKIIDDEASVAADASAEGAASVSGASGIGQPSEAAPFTDPLEIWKEAYGRVKADPEFEDVMKEFEEAILEDMPRPSVDSEHCFSNQPPNTSLVEKVANMTPGNRHDLMHKLASGEGRQSHHSGMMLQVAPIFEQTKQGISAVLDVYPPAAIAWAGVCLVLSPALNHAKAIKSNSDGLTYILSRLPRYVTLIQLLGSDAWQSHKQYQKSKMAIRDNLVEMYRLIIEYQVLTFASYHHRCRHFFTNALGLADWEGRVEALRSLEKEVAEDVDFDFQTQVLAHLEGTKKQSEERREDLIRTLNQQHSYLEERDRKSERNRIIELFKPRPDQHNYEAYQSYIEKIKNPLEKTGDGIRDHPRFRGWVNGESPLFLLVANPGSGKSVFTKSLLQDGSSSLLATPGHSSPPTVCSFFFRDSGQQNKPNVALLKILYELLLIRDDTVTALQSEVDRLDVESIRASTEKLWGLLEKATKHAEKDSIVILFDALDEIDSEQQSGFVTRLQAWANDAVRIYVTTRPIQPILEQFISPQQYILNLNEDRECGGQLSADISLVAESYLASFCRDKGIYQADIQEDLLRELRKHIETDQTYIFVDRLFDYLAKQEKERLPRRWVQTFKKLPTTLLETYGALLETIENKDDVKLMLQIFLAAARPLTVREMNIALNVNDMDSASNIDDLQLMTVKDFTDWIHGTCHFFLVIYDSRVHFMHQTVRDYLLPHPSDDQRPRWLADGFTENGCHQAMLKSCLQYISADFVKEPTGLDIAGYFNAPLYTQLEIQQWLQERFDFAGYAFTKWVFHLNRIPKSDSRAWSEVLEEIQEKGPSFSLDRAKFVFCCSALPSWSDLDDLGSYIASGHDLSEGCILQGLISRFSNGQDEDDLSSFVVTASLGLEIMEFCDPMRERILVDLCCASMLKPNQDFEGGEEQLCGFLLDQTERAVRETAIDSINRSRALSYRAEALRRRFCSLEGYDEDIDCAIEDIETALAPVSYSLSAADKIQFTHQKAICYLSRYKDKSVRQSGDLDTAIAAGQLAADGLSRRHPRRGNVLQTLSAALLEKARVTKSMEHIDYAIHVIEQAVDSKTATLPAVSNDVLSDPWALPSRNIEYSIVIDHKKLLSQRSAVLALKAAAE